MKTKKIFLLVYVVMSTNAFADVSDTFPDNKLMLENRVYKDAAVFENMGVYEGVVNATAVYEDLRVSCDRGYYLPADAEECALCLENNYCTGGTYTYNVNLAQGITACDNGLFAPTGMWESAQCGRKLHVGDDVVYMRTAKKTTPSLRIDMNHDGVAEYFGNTTKTRTRMNKDSTRYFHIDYGDNHYYLCDDTTCPDGE